MVVRLFVGGLPPNISSADLRTRFASFGNVTDIEIVSDKDGNIPKDPGAHGGVPWTATKPCRGFAYVNLEPKVRLLPSP